ncbi:MAG: DUF3261 domain-containing protein [Xanthomonadales bacterium]|nr:DUF3261 domain-containing protein [Xanthomonadales bacterium]
MSMLRLLLCALMPLWLLACAHAPPASTKAVSAPELPRLRMTPAALGQSVSLQQRLEFRIGGQSRVLDGLLEVDAEAVRLVVQALGQPGVRLVWDGERLEQRRAPWLPSAVRGERVLDDLQFALWPAEAIRQVLPPGWSLRDDGRVRELEAGGHAWLVLERLDDRRLQLHNRAEGYSLLITSAQSLPSTEAGP